MKRKILLFLLLVVSAVCLVAGVAACDNDSSGQSGSSFDSGQANSDQSQSETAAITAINNATINGYEIYIFVEANTSNISLSDKVTCTENSIWNLYDSDGKTVIPTKVITSLSDGENLFYIVVNSTSDSTISVTYTVTVYKSFAVTVSYYNGNNLLYREIAYSGYTYSAEYIPEIADYTFNCWKTSDGQIYSTTKLWTNLTLYAEFAEQVHNYITEWSYDNTAHWHACLGDGCDEKADYEEHTPAADGYSDGTTIYYTCEVCGAEYTSSLATYIINVLNIGNAGVEGVSVKLYDTSGAQVGSGTSASNGVVRFRNLSLADYTAVIDATTIPNGYSYDNESDLTISLSATTRSSSIYLTPHLITDTAITSSTSFTLGSVMYDFEATVYYNDGSSETKKLSDYLAEYDAVVLNFFFTTCSPCLSEFPYVNQAYNTTLSSTTSDYYYKNIAMIEVDYTGRDTSISYFKNFITGNYGYDNFSYIYDDSTNLVSAFGVSTFPTTVVIDKYGVVSVIDVGSQPTCSYWTTLYETYLEENYETDYS